MNKQIKIFLIVLASVVLLGSVFIFIFGSKYVQSLDDKAATSAPEEVETPESQIAEIEIPAVSANTISENEIKEPTDEELYGGEPYTTVVHPSEEGVLSISFAGDILFDPSYSTYSSYLSRGSDINTCFSKDLLDKMHETDIMMINNEFPYSDRGTPQADKTYTFRAPTNSAKLLDDMGVDIVTLANNHTFDYGEEAFLDTLDTLDSVSMPHVGAGHNIDEAAQPYYFVAGGKKIAIIGATQIERYANPNTRGATDNLSGVFRCLEPERLIEEIKKAKSECDFVILFIHWGTESTDELDWCQEPQAKQYVEAGVDIIIGCHPHVLQEVAYIEDTPVVYSLGNFWFNSKTLDSCLVTLNINLEDCSIDSLQFEPCIQQNMKTSLLHGDEKKRVLDYMRSISSSASFDDEGYITKGDN